MQSAQFEETYAYSYTTMLSRPSDAKYISSVHSCSSVYDINSVGTLLCKK